MKLRTTTASALLAATVSSLLFAGSATAAGPATPHGSGDGSPAAPRIHVADSRADDAVRGLQHKVEKLVGAATGGSYLDSHGRLVVTTTTDAATRAARAAGAVAQRVDDSLADLNGVQSALDRFARGKGAGSIQSWRVDIAANSVVVVATKDAGDAGAKAFLANAKRFGDTVRVEQIGGRAATTTDSLYGGAQYTPNGAGNCSIGFTAVDASNRSVFISAGHCVTAGQWVHRNGYWVGDTRASRFPGNDYSVVNNQYSAYWLSYSLVSQYNGSYMPVHGSWGNPPAGATSCKSGRTTGWTCGQILSFNTTVNYGGQMVYGLVTHTACTEPGDSGGSVISAGGYALGLTSGAVLYGTNKVCGQKVGQATRSYYQPIVPVLQATGTRLLTR